MAREGILLEIRGETVANTRGRSPPAVIRPRMPFARHMKQNTGGFPLAILNTVVDMHALTTIRFGNFRGLEATLKIIKLGFGKIVPDPL